MFAMSTPTELTGNRPAGKSLWEQVSKEEEKDAPAVASKTSKQESTQQKWHFALLTGTAHMIRYVNSLENNSFKKSTLNRNA